MRLALLFSGQGQQTTDHLERLRAGADEDQHAALAAALPGEWRRGAVPGLPIHANRVAQPLIFALQMQLWQQIAGRVGPPVCAAGYSLGEMAACCAAGLFGVSEGIALCAQRAAAMDACVMAPAGMLAVVGLDRSQVDALAGACHVHIAIRNAPDHFVLGGLADDLLAAADRALAEGATRTVRLGVGTPSHTPLLEAASATLAARFAPYANRRLGFPVLSAIDGRPARAAGVALDALARQVAQPLDWATCMDEVIERQPDAVLEIGPGTALARMWNERQSGIPARASDDFRTADGIVDWLERTTRR